MTEQSFANAMCASLSTLALFRLVLGLVAIANAVSLLQEARWWFLEGGVSPARHAAPRVRKRFSLYLLFGVSDRVTSAVLVLHLAACIGFTAGILPRAAAFAAWLTLTTIHARNTDILYGGDSLLRILLLLSACLPVESASMGVLSSSWTVMFSSDQVCSVGVLCMKLQISLVYGHAVVAKLRRRSWREGIAIGLSLRQEGIRRFGLPRLLQKRSVLRAATYLTLAIEAALPVFLFLPQTATAAVAAAILFHTALHFALAIQFFSWIMVAAVVIFLPGGAGSVIDSGHDLLASIVAIGVVGVGSVWPIFAARLPRPVRRAIDWAWLGQRWNMFCVVPPVTVSSRVTVRVWSNAGKVFSFHWRGPESLPAQSAALAHRFKKYEISISKAPRRDLLLGLAECTGRMAGVGPDLAGMLVRTDRLGAYDLADDPVRFPSSFSYLVFTKYGAARILDAIASDLEGGRDLRALALLASVVEVTPANFSTQCVRTRMRRLLAEWEVDDVDLAEVLGEISRVREGESAHVYDEDLMSEFLPVAERVLGDTAESPGELR